MPTNLPASSRRRVEAGLRELRTWLAMARHDRRESTDPEQRVHLRLLIDDLEFLVYRLERLLHPASTERLDDDQNGGTE